jgi:hypothetical protein
MRRMIGPGPSIRSRQCEVGMVRLCACQLNADACHMLDLLYAEMNAGE